MVLAHHFGKALRPQLVGEGTRRIAIQPGRCEQPSGFPLAPRAHPPTTAEICCAPRWMVSRHRRLG